MTWVVIILAIVAWIGYRFFSDLKTEEKKVAASGGMRVKYAKLVEWALSGHQDCRIINESASDILVGCTGASGSTTFQFIQTFGQKIIIRYNVKSVFFGNHNIDWTFPESMEQSQMIEKMEADIAAFTMREMQKYK